MLRPWLTAAVVATYANGFFLRYLEHFTPKVHDENESIIFTLEGAKPLSEWGQITDATAQVTGSGRAVDVANALTKEIEEDAAKKQSSAPLRILLQSRVDWRDETGYTGYTVDRSMVHVKKPKDLLPISSAVVLMDDAKCNVDGRGAKRAFADAQFTTDAPPAMYGKDSERKKASGGFVRRPWDAGEKLKVECTDGEDKTKSQSFGIATKGAVATKFEYELGVEKGLAMLAAGKAAAGGAGGGNQAAVAAPPVEAGTANLYVSLAAKHFYVPVYMDFGDKSGFYLIQIKAESHTKPTYCELKASTDPSSQPFEVKHCGEAEDKNYQAGALVFLKRPGWWPGHKTQVHRQKNAQSKPKGRVYLVLKPATKSENKKGEIHVPLGSGTAIFAKTRGGWNKSRNVVRSGVTLAKAANVETSEKAKA